MSSFLSPVEKTVSNSNRTKLPSERLEGFKRQPLNFSFHFCLQKRKAAKLPSIPFSKQFISKHACLANVTFA